MYIFIYTLHFSLVHFLKVLFTVKHAVVCGKKVLFTVKHVVECIEERCRLLLNSGVQKIDAKIAKQHNSNNKK